jgi:hypothetical protein
MQPGCRGYRPGSGEPAHDAARRSVRGSGPPSATILAHIQRMPSDREQSGRWRSTWGQIQRGGSGLEQTGRRSGPSTRRTWKIRPPAQDFPPDAQDWDMTWKTCGPDPDFPQNVRSTSTECAASSRDCDETRRSPQIGAVAPMSLPHKRDHAAAVKRRHHDEDAQTLLSLLDQTTRVVLPTRVTRKRPATSGSGRRPCWPAPCGRCRPCA